MKRINYLLLLSMAFMLILASCGKDGAVGPAGPAGPTGPAGSNGSNGTAGTAGATGSTGAVGATGATGSANVIYSDWYTPSAYTKDTIFNTYHFYANIAASKITQAILDNGTVLVYAKLDGYNPVIWPSAQVGMMPITITYNYGSTATVYNDTWTALATVGNIKIDFVDNLNYYNAIATSHQFRYIIIPGGVHTLASVNTRNYNQVALALHLKD